MLNRFDAAFTGENAIFLEQQLKVVQDKVFSEIFPALRAREFVPVNRSVSDGAETVATRIWEQFGQAKIINNGSDDFPAVTVGQREAISKVKSLGCFFEYTMLDLRRAMVANIPLDEKLATSSRQVIEAKIDELASNGDEKSGLVGLCNNPNVPKTDLKPWFDKTGTLTKTNKELLDDIFGMVASVMDRTNNAVIPDTLLLPVKHFAYLSQTPYSPNSNITLLSFLLANNPFIKNIDSWTRLKDRMIVYPRTPQAVEMFIPNDFEMLPPQPVGMTLRIYCMARFGGVQIYMPTACNYGVGI